MNGTKKWAAALGVCVDESVPPVEDYDEGYGRTAEEIAIRAIILHSVAAVGYEVEPEAIIQWLKNEKVWVHVSPAEKAFFLMDEHSDNERANARWRQEALWALLWTIGKVESLGLPTKTCDTGKLIDEIMPGLGDPIDAFVSSAKLRAPGELLAEEDRIYDLHCYARQAEHKGAMPDDLKYEVLFQRHYAFEWLGGEEDWDDIRAET